ncbi:MAG: sulfite exporter TauE/SafE family protein [Candidatus Hadarchaeum sp.]|uniref:sulfite exporter TauE/SafE family protein n=1 Tax=Candidatus Hadarchaeum sp. TaxID=2883567 RepID=UPI003D0AFAFA
MLELILFSSGLLIATLFSMIGLAGGSFIVPMMVLAFGLPTQQAVGVSLFAVMFTTISATLAYAVQRKIHFKVGLLLDTLDVPGAFLGAYLTTLVASNWLAGMFGGLLIFLAARMFQRRNSVREIETTESLRLSRRVVAATVLGSLASGIVSGMFGVGGGVIDELVMILMLGMSIRLSAGTAMFGMAITTVAALVPHWLLGNVLLEYAVPLTIGCVIGGQIGPYLSKRTSAAILRRILAAVFVVIGVRMLLVSFLGG